jgi:alpha-L-fucosidase
MENNRWARNPQSQDIDMPRLVKEVRAKQPKLIVVDRAVPGEQQNYLTPEQQIPENGLPYPWETCMTMATSWSYVPNDTYKPANEIIKKLVDIVSKGGNYLLNIGPGPDGELDANAYQRLKEIGGWMKVNSEAIYGTRMSKVFGEGDNIRYTQSKDGKTQYIFLFNFPDDKLTLTRISLAKNAKLQLLGSKKKIDWKKVSDGVEIKIPSAEKTVTDYVWVIKVQQ